LFISPVYSGGSFADCATCSGTGIVEVEEGGVMVPHDCETCDGHGFVFTANTGEENAIPVFVNRLKPGSLHIKKEISPLSESGYDPDQTFRFRVIISGDFEGSPYDGDTISYTITEGNPIITYTFDGNGGYFDGDTNKTEFHVLYEYDGTNATWIQGDITKVPVRTGYTFGGWTDKPDGTTVFDPSTDFPLFDCTVYAIWTPDP
jgi:uncharacterized repeat protein (TIGR02543 family)